LLPAHLLLLPQGLLPGVLAVAGGLRGARATGALHRRDRFPLIFQNSHRYFFYAAAALATLNTYDAIVAFHSDTGPGGSVRHGQHRAVRQRGDAVGLHRRLPLLPTRVRRAAYPLPTKNPVRYWLWSKISWFNGRHMQFAWITLGTLAFTDFYVWMVSSGVIHDIRFIG
jgi:hypothetical protein